MNNEQQNMEIASNTPKKANRKKSSPARKRLLGTIAGTILAVVVAFGGGIALSQFPNSVTPSPPPDQAGQLPAQASGTASTSPKTASRGTEAVASTHSGNSPAKVTPATTTGASALADANSAAVAASNQNPDTVPSANPEAAAAVSDPNNAAVARPIPNNGAAGLPSPNTGTNPLPGSNRIAAVPNPNNATAPGANNANRLQNQAGQRLAAQPPRPNR